MNSHVESANQNNDDPANDDVLSDLLSNPSNLEDMGQRQHQVMRLSDVLRQAQAGASPETLINPNSNDRSQEQLYSIVVAQ